MRYSKESKFTLSLIVIVFLLINCSGNQANEKAIEAHLTVGFSGLAKIDQASFLTVYDLKSFEDGFRLGMIDANDENGYGVKPVHISDWKDEDGRGSDLEAVCKLPQRENEFLITESGHWGGEFGRMFHVKLDGITTSPKAEVVGVFELPVFAPKGPANGEGDEFEGLACIQNEEDKVLLIFGERGGSSVYSSGLIRWAEADLTSYTFNWSEKGRAGYEVDAPGDWQNSSQNRDIADLFVDEELNLWAVAAEDLGDKGPFHSIIYKIGEIDLSENEPVKLKTEFKVYRSIAGFKVEGLSAGIENGFSISTEDEDFGGVWRLIR